MSNTPEPITLYNASQVTLQNKHGEPYLIQISWPLHWKDKNEGNGISMPIL